jgi:hypothetical protein
MRRILVFERVGDYLRSLWYPYKTCHPICYRTESDTVSEVCSIESASYPRLSDGAAELLRRDCGGWMNASNPASQIAW